MKKLFGAWVICEPWFTGSQTLGELLTLSEPEVLVHGKSV
jgi:hypothetical protein